MYIDEIGLRVRVTERSLPSFQAEPLSAKWNMDGKTQQPEVMFLIAEAIVIGMIATTWIIF